MAIKIVKTKMCTRHGVTHPVTDFPKDSKQHDRLSSWCKISWREYRAEKAAGKGTPKKTAGAKPAGKKPTAKKVAKGRAAKPAKEVN